MKNPPADIADMVSKLRRELPETILHSIRVDLSLAESFVDLSRDWYARGYSEFGYLAKCHGQRAIDTIRCFISTSPLIEPESKAWISKRCDELQWAIAALPMGEP